MIDIFINLAIIQIQVYGSIAQKQILALWLFKGATSHVVRMV